MNKMPESLNISVLQFNISWENIDENLKAVQHKTKGLKTDILVLPEMFTTGFTMQPHLFAQKNKTDSLPFMQNLANKLNALVVGSLIWEENGKYYNRLFFVEHNGSYHKYDKKHLFSLSEEPLKYTNGNRQLIIKYKGWNIAGLICYDLRFPIWSRNTNYQYDVLIYSANWPSVRTYAWSQLLIARAIENQAYVIGCNRVGNDNNGFEHSGCSQVLNYIGKSLAVFKENESQILSTEINYAELIAYRKSFPILTEDDQFNLI